MSELQFNILSVLSTSKGGMQHCYNLAALLGKPYAAIAAAARALQKREYVAEYSQERYGLTWTLTPEGRAFMERRSR